MLRPPATNGSRDTELRQLADAGYSTARLAKRYKISGQRVRQIVKAAPVLHADAAPADAAAVAAATPATQADVEAVRRVFQDARPRPGGFMSRLEMIEARVEMIMQAIGIEA